MVERQPDDLDLDAIFHALAHPIRRATLEQDGRVRRSHLNAAPLSEVFRWLTRYRVFWEDRFDALADHLENED